MCKWNPNAPKICGICGKKKSGWEHVCRGSKVKVADPARSAADQTAKPNASRSPNPTDA